MKIKTLKLIASAIGRFSLLGIFVGMLAVFLVVTGCDEGMKPMMDPVMDEVMSEKEEPTIVGEMKKPEDTETPATEPVVTEKPVVIAKPSGIDLKASSDSGPIDNITAETMPVITVHGTLVGTTVTVTAVKEDDVVTASADGNGGDLDITLGTLSDGEWSVTAVQSTEVGTSDATSPFIVTIDTMPPTVVSVKWYSDEQLEELIVDSVETIETPVAQAFLSDEQLEELIVGSVRPEDTVYVKIVFSEPVTHVPGSSYDGARPHLSLLTKPRMPRIGSVGFWILPRDANSEDFISGTCKPLQDNTSYICKYTVPSNRIETLHLWVDPTTADINGTAVAEPSRHYAPFTVEDGPPTRVDLHQVWKDKEAELTSAPDWERITIDEGFERRYQAFYEVFGFTDEFAERLVFDVFLEEWPEGATGLKFWQNIDIAVEYRYLQLHNPDATEEELIELLRESIRAGEVTIDIDSLLSYIDPSA